MMPLAFAAWIITMLLVLTIILIHSANEAEIDQHTTSICIGITTIGTLTGLTFFIIAFFE